MIRTTPPTRPASSFRVSTWQFVQDGSYLIPVTQGLVFSGSKYWNYIIGPGRIWQENGDHGYARASFPFTLVERNQNCTHNGVMTFLFNGTQVSQVRYQITQETCLYFKFDLWGQAAAAYTPDTIPQAAALKAAHAAEVANRLPTKPIAALATDYPGSGCQPDRLWQRDHSRGHDRLRAGHQRDQLCLRLQTRYGEYAYCESMRLPSYSTAKSAFAALALMRLGQKYGTGVYDLLIKDYVPEAATAAGDWSSGHLRERPRYGHRQLRPGRFRAGRGRRERAGLPGPGGDLRRQDPATPSASPTGTRPGRCGSTTPPIPSSSPGR